MSAGPTPFDDVGGAPAVRRLVDRFYLEMEVIGWLGGPQDYHQRHGHPRLRMRHAAVPIGEAMRDAWLRSMRRALDAEQVGGELRAFLDERFAEVADFLRNRAG